MDEKIVKDSQGLVKDLVNDTISRQATIMALVFSEDTGGMTCGQMAKVLDVIKAVPSAQPSSSCSHEKGGQPEPEEPFARCSDCIHDDDSLDICVLRLCKHAIAETVECFEPKQPERKRGKWIDDGDPFMWVCGCCGYRVKRYNNTRYCPNCGADMRGDADE